MTPLIIPGRLYVSNRLLNRNIDVWRLVTSQIIFLLCLYVSSEAIVGPYQILANAVAGFDWVTAEELERLTPLTPADEANREKLIALIR